MEDLRGRSLQGVYIEIIMLTEHRVITQEERKNLEPILEKLSVQSTEDILRFVDTVLDKVYDVYLIKIKEEACVLKMVGESCGDKEKYDAYFLGKDFSVPRVFECVSIDDKNYVLMQFVKGADARGCTVIQASHIGAELGRIQSFYLADGGHTEVAERYWSFFEKFYENLKTYIPDVDDVWGCVKQRFFEAPHTLIHEDLLPINVLIDEEEAWIIDWEVAGIYPYFLDLARFAFMFSDSIGDFFIPQKSANAFIDAYYDEMKKNTAFTIDKKQFLYDVAISAFCQYISFLDYDKSLDEIEDTVDFKFLKEIICYLTDKAE